MRTNSPLAAAVALLGAFACRDAPTVPRTASSLPTTASAATAPSPPQDLGVFGTGAQAFSISSNGTVVGQFDTQAGEIRAFMWTAKTGMAPLPSPAGSTMDWAWSVNDAGQAVGFSNLATGQFAILWAKGVAYNLGTLAGGAGTSTANGINRTGQVVGSSSFAGPSGVGGQHAMLWTPNAVNGTTGTMYDLGTLDDDGYSYARSINDAGQVVGTASVGGVAHAFLWTPSVPNGTTGTMVDLDPGGTESYAFGLNDRGDVVGQHAAAGSVRAFIWNAATGLTDIGTLPGGSNSAALGVDRLGRVVGFAINSVGQWRPFVWTSKGGGGMQDLGTLEGGQSTYGEAWATNPKGQAVGSSQTANGQIHATLWTLP